METNIITKIEFFDFMRAFFTDDSKYQKLTQNAKKPHFFMWRRMMSIQYPIQMNALSMLDDVRIMDVLHKHFITKEYPKWLYASSKNGNDTKTKVKESLLKKYTRDVLDLFMDHYSLEWQSVIDLEFFCPDLLYKELDNLDEELHPQFSKEKLSKAEKENMSNKKPVRKGFTFKSKK